MEMADFAAGLAHLDHIPYQYSAFLYDRIIFFNKLQDLISQVREVDEGPDSSGTEVKLEKTSRSSSARCS
jgi:hypothetical protein